MEDETYGAHVIQHSVNIYAVHAGHTEANKQVKVAEDHDSSSGTKDNRKPEEKATEEVHDEEAHIGHVSTACIILSRCIKHPHCCELCLHAAPCIGFSLWGSDSSAWLCMPTLLSLAAVSVRLQTEVQDEEASMGHVSTAHLMHHLQ